MGILIIIPIKQPVMESKSVFFRGKKTTRSSHRNMSEDFFLEDAKKGLTQMYANYF